MVRKAGSRSDRQAGRLTERQTDRKTDRQTHRQKTDIIELVKIIKITDRHNDAF